MVTKVIMIVLKILAIGLAAVVAGGAAWWYLVDPMGGPPLTKVRSVDMSRFVGDWYVIANIPTYVEKGATNAIERYELHDDGSIKVTFTFDQDRPGGERKQYDATAWVVDTATNAEWRVQFFWPIKFPYSIIELADDYSYTVVGVPNRNYVWIMARTPSLPDSTFRSLLQRVDSHGFDTSKIETVPQVWPAGEGGR
jgi:apolipoprotein D and lipocalin family protein